MPGQKIIREFCPLVEAPMEDCFCYDFRKNDHIKLAVYYCGENFHRCHIYKSYQASLERAEKYEGIS